MNLRRSLLVAGLAPLIASLPLLGSGGAMLIPVAGSIAVNGHTIAASSAMVVGDSAAVSQNGTARLVLPGGSVIAAAKTSFRLMGGDRAAQVRLGYGEVKVTGLPAVALNRHTVVPQSADAQYTVIALNGPVYVQAVAGKVLIRAGNQSYAVRAGEAVSFNDDASAAGGVLGGNVPAPISIGIIAAAAVVTGIVVHSATECSNCVASPTSNIQ